MAKGGKRQGAGRPVGAVAKATADIRDAAQQFTSDALEVLVSVMRSEEHPAAARVAAANAVLDRGHGKPKQSLDIDATLAGELVTRIEMVGVRPGDNSKA